MASSSSFSPVLYRTLWGRLSLTPRENPKALGAQQLTGCVGSGLSPVREAPGPQLVVFRVLPENQGPRGLCPEGADPSAQQAEAAAGPGGTEELLQSRSCSPTGS